MWERFGDVRNYVEPFCGSAAVLLARPHAPQTETVNDANAFISNFYRAITAAPQEVAYHADWPVNEADLHARHLWLMQSPNAAYWRERIKADPDYYDAKVAGWWVWGSCCWIGSGWCSGGYLVGRDGGGSNKMPAECEHGIHKASLYKKMPDIKGHRGVQRTELPQKRPRLMNTGNAGAGVTRRPHLGRPYELQAVGASPRLSMWRGTAIPVDDETAAGGIVGWFNDLADRLRRVRVCCGDWSRVLTPAVTTYLGTTGVFLDPPYADTAGRDSEIYAVDDLQVAHAAREWAIANGDNPDFRIALCGYEGEHVMPDSWAVFTWKTQGGYGHVQKPGVGLANRVRERIWFSPHCITAKQGVLL